MPRNIVICCDGTGNQIDTSLSNVLKLFRVLRKDAAQLVYYNPGVGTVGDFDTWQLVKQRVRDFLGLLFGNGLDQNVLDAYRFLCTNYRHGENVGRYLDNTGFIPLVANGWIGITSAESALLKPMVRQLVEEGRSLMIAVARRRP